MALGDTNEERAHMELLALQELVRADIAFFKNQQWQAAYYGLLLYAAIAAVPKVIESITRIGFVVLWLVVLVVLLTGLYVLSELESALVKRRKLLPFARKHFTPEALTAYGLGDPSAALQPAEEKVSLKRVFMSAYVLGFSLTTWILVVGCANA